MRISEDAAIRNRSSGCSQEYASKAVALLLSTQMHSTQREHSSRPGFHHAKKAGFDTKEQSRRSFSGNVI
jgi:hypothetical protein